MPRPKLTNTATTFILQVKRCDEMARKLRFFKEQVGMRVPVTEARASGCTGYDRTYVA